MKQLIEARYKHLRNTLPKSQLYAILIEHDCLMWKLGKKKHLIVGAEVFLEVDIEEHVT